MLSHRLWRERFGSDPGIIGKTITLDGTAVPVVGVMPPGFAFPRRRTELWLSLYVPPTGLGAWNYGAVARLASGHTPEALERELAALLPVLRETSDDPSRAKLYFDDAKIFPRIAPLKEDVVGPWLRGRNLLVAGQVALALVLLIGSGLLFRTFRNMHAVDLGFSERQALTFELGLPWARYESRARARLPRRSARAAGRAAGRRGRGRHRHVPAARGTHVLGRGAARRGPAARRG